MQLTFKAENRYQFKSIPCVTFISMEREKGTGFYPDKYRAEMKGSFDLVIHSELIGYNDAQSFINCIRTERYALAAFSTKALTELFEALDGMFTELQKY